jgi:hypothetical protein
MLSAVALAFSSCSKEEPLRPDAPIATQPSNVVSDSGKTDGVAYSLNNLVLNPEVIVLNSDNSTLQSSADELARGVIRVSTDLPVHEESVLYIRSGEYTGLRKVSSISRSTSGEYLLETTPAQLGELFEGGELELSLDLQDVTRAVYGFDRNCEIIDIQDEYRWDDLTYNPATNVKLALNMQMEFKKLQLLPCRFSTWFEITPTLSPYLSTTGALNQAYGKDVSELLPVELVEFLENQEFDFDIPIGVLGIESIPAKLRIDDIKIPTHIETNLSTKTNFAFNVSGSYKVGYEINISGLKATTKPIYENNITAEVPDMAANMPGELLTNAEVVITPNISVLDDLYSVSGDIVFGFRTETAGNASLQREATNFASKGVFTSRMNLLVDLILEKVPVNIFSDEKELWNTGSFDKTVEYSNLSWKVSSKSSSNLLLLSKMYETDFTLNYSYHIQGKKIPDELLISYEVYQDNNKTRIQSVTDLVIVPTNVTEDSFKFKLDIPYKDKLLMLSFQTTSYLKNIVIRDRNGYEFSGILNSKGEIENSFTIKR